MGKFGLEVGSYKDGYNTGRATNFGAGQDGRLFLVFLGRAILFREKLDGR